MEDPRSHYDVQRPAPDLVMSYGDRRILLSAIDGDVVIGRECPPAHVCIDHPGISRAHARLVPGNPWRLIDYESLNGVYLDGQRVSYEAVVTDGLTVHLGHPIGVVVTFSYVTAPTWCPTPPVADVSRDDSRAPALQPTDGEATEVITDAVRRTLLVDSMCLSLAAVAKGLARKPVAAHGCAEMRERLARVDRELDAVAALGALDVASALRAVHDVYQHRIDDLERDAPRAW
jgi:hypothetical protein